MHMGVTPGVTVTYRNYDYDVNEKVTKDYAGPETSWAVVGSATMDGDADGYSWNMVRVWQHRQTRALAIAHASGCSCYAPFDDLTVKGLTFLSRLTEFDAFVAEHERMQQVYEPVTGRYSEQQRHPRVVDQVVRLREQVAALTRKQRRASSR